jgi:hypothetical protein
VRALERLAKLLDLEEIHVGPWIGHIDKGKPVAILPAGRPGEVCSAKGMSKVDFDWLIKTHNDRWNKRANATLTKIETELERLGKK